jgi:putative GTP pyrophosphokinase
MTMTSTAAAVTGELRKEYEGREPQLVELALRLERECTKVLETLPHVDRVSFRAKKLSSFLKKAEGLLDDGRPKYNQPLADIEDQVAGRILVFFRRDITGCVEALRKRFNSIELKDKTPVDRRAFAYESTHLVCTIPPDMKPAEWSNKPYAPTTFEMQVRTLFMHAWAEPEHDISYKAKHQINEDLQRLIAWAGASAWGGDAIFEQVLSSLESRTSGGKDDEPNTVDAGGRPAPDS